MTKLEDVFKKVGDRTIIIDQFNPPIRKRKTIFDLEIDDGSYDEIIRNSENEIFKKRLYSLPLSEKELKIIKMRYGFIDGIQRTREEIANEFGVTRERMFQIDNKITEKIYNLLKNKYKI